MEICSYWTVCFILVWDWYET